jgi:hypothetical protein
LFGSSRATAVPGAILELERASGAGSTPLGLKGGSWTATGARIAGRARCTDIAILAFSSLRGAVGATTGSRRVAAGGGSAGHCSETASACGAAAIGAKMASAARASAGDCRATGGGCGIGWLRTGERLETQKTKVPASTGRTISSSTTEMSIFGSRPNRPRPCGFASLVAGGRAGLTAARIDAGGLAMGAPGGVWTKAAASNRTPENRPAQPRQYLALSRLGAWHASQNLVIPCSTSAGRGPRLRHGYETCDEDQ